MTLLPCTFQHSCSTQWSYKFVKHAFKVEKLLFIQAFSTITTHKALFGEYGTSVQT